MEAGPGDCEAFKSRALPWKTLLEFVQINPEAIDFKRRGPFLVTDENRNRPFRAVNRKSVKTVEMVDPAFYDGGNHDLSDADDVVQFDPDPHERGPNTRHPKRTAGGRNATGVKLSSAMTSPETRGPEKSGLTAIDTAEAGSPEWITGLSKP